VPVVQLFLLGLEASGLQAQTNGCGATGLKTEDLCKANGWLKCKATNY